MCASTCDSTYVQVSSPVAMWVQGQEELYLLSHLSIPYIIFLNETRTQVQEAINSRIYFLASSGPPYFRSTSLSLLWDVLLLLYCNISALAKAKFPIAFVQSPCGKLCCRNNQCFSLLCSLQVGCAQLMFMLTSRLPQCFTSIIGVWRGRCGNTEPLHRDFGGYSHIPEQGCLNFLETHGQA